MAENARQQMTLILGGTGKTGRRVAQRLTARGMPVRIGSRSARPPFDWEERSTWRAALRDVTAVYVTYYPDLAMPGAADAIRAFADQAVASGVRRLVLLSGRGEPEARRCEEIIQGYPVEWTCVVASMFSQDFSEHFLLEPVRSGVVAFPAGDMAEPFVDCEDIADVVAAALAEQGHVGRVYEVTGPRLLTFTEAVGEIAKVTGRDLRYVPISPQEYAAGLVEEGAPAELAAFLSHLFGTIFDGRNAHVGDGVQQALGRPARDFSDYARAAAATGVWRARP